MVAGQRLKKIREELKLTQSAFAKRIRRDRTTIAKLEAGTIELTPAMRQSICAEFKVNEEWLVSEIGVLFYNNSHKTQAAPLSFAEPPRHPAAALIPVPDYNTPGIDPSIQAMSDIKEIFDSGDPILIPAIQANLHAFKRALLRERQFEQILRENDELKKRILKLEELFTDLKGQFESLQSENNKLRTENKKLRDHSGGCAPIKLTPDNAALTGTDNKET